MARYVGLTSEEIYTRLQNETEDRVYQQIRSFEQNLDKLFEASGKNFWNKVGDGLSIASGGLYNLLKGFSMTLPSLFYQGGLTGLKIAEEVSHIFDDEDSTIEYLKSTGKYDMQGMTDEDWRREARRFDTRVAITNLTTDTVESVGTAILSSVGHIGQWLGRDPDHMFGEDGVLEGFDNDMKQLRSFMMMGETNISLKKGAMIDVTGETFASETDSYYNHDPERLDHFLEDRRYDEIDENIGELTDTYGSIDEWIESKFGGMTERSRREFGDDRLYQAGMSVANSVGKIAMLSLIGKLSNRGFSMSQINNARTAMFASSVYGDAFYEAYKNGATINDSYKYAVGQAVTETALENVSGFGGLSTTSQTLGKKIFGDLLDNKWIQFATGVIGEGMEEVGAEFAGTGLSRYLNPENEMDVPTLKEFNEKLMYAFAGGALASGAIGGTHLMLNSTIENKYVKVKEMYNKNVEKMGKEKAWEELEKRLTNVVHALNNPKQRGMTVENNPNSNDPMDNIQYVHKLTDKEKIDFVRKTGMSKMIEITEENGKITFDLADSVKNGDSDVLFGKNTVDGNEVTEGEYAHNSATVNKDLTDEGRVTPVKTEDMNETDKKAMEYSEKLNVPVVLIHDVDNAGILGENGVIYISSDHLTENNIEETIIKHETLHAISEMFPEGYQKISEMVDELVQMEKNEAQDGIMLEYKSEAVKKLLQSVDFEQKIIESFENYHTNLKNKFSSSEARIRKAIQLTHEEIRAFFVEDFLEGGKMLEILGRENKGLVERMKQQLNEGKAIKNMVERVDGNKKEKKILAKQIKKISKEYDKNARKISKYHNTMGAFIDNVFGDNYVASSLFNKKYLEDHDPQDIMDAFIDTHNPNDNTMELDGKRIPVNEVFTNMKEWRGTTPKRVAPSKKDIRARFKFKPENITAYKRALREYIESHEDFHTYKKEFLKNHTEEELDEMYMETFNVDKYTMEIDGKEYPIEEVYVSGREDFFENKQENMEMVKNLTFAEFALQVLRSVRNNQVEKRSLTTKKITQQINDMLVDKKDHISEPMLIDFLADIMAERRYQRLQKQWKRRALRKKYDPESEAINRIIRNAYNFFKSNTPFKHLKGSGKNGYLEISFLFRDENDTVVTDIEQLKQEAEIAKKLISFYMTQKRMKRFDDERQSETMDNVFEIVDEYYGNVNEIEQWQKNQLSESEKEHTGIVYFYLLPINEKYIEKFTEEIIEQESAKEEDIDTNTPVEKDNQENEISKEKSALLEGSKMRDEDNNILLLYHGSPEKDIKKFDRKKQTINTQSGEHGFFFADEQDFAEQFSYKRIPGSSKFSYVRGEKGRIYQVYLNVKRPFDARSISDGQKEEMIRNYEDKYNLPLSMEDIAHAETIVNKDLLKTYVDINSLSERGYDGYIGFVNDGEDFQKIRTEYIAFNGDQIVPALTETEKKTELTKKERQELQKFYTKYALSKQVTKNTFDILEKTDFDLKSANIIEPSAGSGSFLDVFEELNITQKDSNKPLETGYKAYDIEPEDGRIIKADFLNMDIEYDDSNIVIGNPPFSKQMDQKFLEKSLDIAPVAAFILPMPWNGAYNKQKRLPEEAKLIYSKPLGKQKYDLGYGTQSVKTVFQIWVNGNDSRFDDYTGNYNQTLKDLRIRKPKPITHEDFKMMVLTGNTDKYKKAKEEYFDFAVFRDGNENFNRKIRDFEELRPKGRYVLFTARSKEALKRLESIDFEELSKKGSMIRNGYTTYDIVDEYKKVKKQQQKVTKKKTAKTKPLTDAEKKEIRTVFQDNTIMDLFGKTKQGVLKIKNRLITAKKNKNAKIRINTPKHGTQEYNTNDYAMNLYYNFENPLVDVGNDKVARSIDDFVSRDKSKMSLVEEALDTYLRTTSLNYVLYHGYKSSTLGFSVTQSNIPIIFINTAYANHSPKKMAEIMIHEQVHEMFKNNSEAMIDFGVFFLEHFLTKENGKIVKTSLFTEFEKQNGKKMIPYLKQGYKDKRFITWNLKNIYNLVNKAKNNASKLTQKEKTSLNELNAQMVGIVFSDPVIHRTILDKPGAKFPMHEIYTKLKKSVRINSSEKLFLDNWFKEFDKLYDQYVQTMRKKFPLKQKYTLAELNQFIRDFTNDKFKTRGKLLEKYVKEKSQHKRGDATRTIDNILYIASIFGKNVKSAANTYKQLKEEFAFMKNAVNMFLADKNEGLKLVEEKNGVIPRFKKIRKLITGKNKLLQVWKSAENDNTGMTDLEYIELLQQLHDEAYDLLEKYRDIPDIILKAFNLPEFNIVKDQTIDLVNEIGNFINAFESNTFKSDALVAAVSEGFMKNHFQSFQDMIHDYLTNLKPLKKTISKNTFYGKLLIYSQNYQRNMVQNAANKIYARINAAWNSLMSNPKAANSAVHQDLLNIKNTLQELHNTIKKNKDNLETMEKKLAPILRSIKQQIENSDNIEDSLKETLVDEHLYTVYMQFARLFKDNKQAKDPKTNEPLNMMPIIAMYYPDAYKQIRNLKIEDLVKNFSANQVGKSLGEIFKSFGLHYTSSLSNEINEDNGEYENNAEYAERINHEILNNINADKPLYTKNLDTMFFFMNPQDFFKFYITTLKGKTSFFEDFWREYKNASKRRKDIMQHGEQDLDKWRKSHKGYERYSNEKAKIPQKYLFRMAETDFDQINQKAKENRENFKDQMKDLEDEKKQIREKKKIARLKKQQINQKKNKLNPQSDRYKKLQKEYDKQEKLRKGYQKDIDRIQTELLDVKAKYNRFKGMGVDGYVYEQVQEHIRKNAKKIENIEMTRGQMITLYLALSREIEMVESTSIVENPNISATNHFHYGNLLHLFDNELVYTKGYQKAKSHAKAVFINAYKKKDFRNYIESKFKKKDWEIVDFIKKGFDRNYAYLNEEYRKRYKVDLPRQEIYIPFASLQSNYSRDFDLKVQGKRNMAPANGMVTKTKLGAATPLRIENVFAVLENHNYETAKYQYERLIKDYQSVLVNKSGTVSLQNILSEADSRLGADNHVIDAIEMYFKNILHYRDPFESRIEQTLKTMQSNIVAAVMALNIGSTIKQFGSISTVALKNKINYPKILSNTMMSVGNTRYRKWLMENNSDFYSRAKVHFIPNLSEQITPALNRRFTGLLSKAGYSLAFLVGHTDSMVLVGGFKTLVEQFRKENPKWTEREVFEKANEVLTEEVLIYGVASTDPAFRAPFLNDPKFITRIFSRFQSENVLQKSAHIRNYYLMRNNSLTSGQFFRDIFAELFSAFLSGLVSTIQGVIRGYTDEEDFTHELLINEFLWYNLAGSWPYISQMISTVSFEKEGIELGFPIKAPVFSELSKASEHLISALNGNHPARNVLGALEEISQLTGFPLKNAVRLSDSIARYFSKKGSEEMMEVNRFFHSQTRAQAYAQAVKEGNRREINAYVKNVIKNATARNEIISLQMEFPDDRINLYDRDSFKKMNDEGEYITYEIPESYQEEYRDNIERVVSILIRQKEYRRLPDENKKNAIQRVINYYYNYMKDAILFEKDIIEEIPEMLDFDAVAERSLSYALQTLEKEG